MYVTGCFFLPSVDSLSKWVWIVEKQDEKKHIFNDIKWKSGVRGGEESESEKQSTIIRGEKWKWKIHYVERSAYICTHERTENVVESRRSPKADEQISHFTGRSYLYTRLHPSLLLSPTDDRRRRVYISRSLVQPCYVCSRIPSVHLSSSNSAMHVHCTYSVLQLVEKNENNRECVCLMNSFRTLPNTVDVGLLTTKVRESVCRCASGEQRVGWHCRHLFRLIVVSVLWLGRTTAR